MQIKDNLSFSTISFPSYLAPPSHHIPNLKAWNPGCLVTQMNENLFVSSENSGHHINTKCLSIQPHEHSKVSQAFKLHLGKGTRTG